MYITSYYGTGSFAVGQDNKLETGEKYKINTSEDQVKDIRTVVNSAFKYY